MSSALYPQAKTSEDGSVSVANTNRDGTTGTYTTLATGTASGNKEIARVRWVADGTTTTGFLRLFVHDGTTAVLVAEIPVPPNTPRTTFPQVPVVGGVWQPPTPIPLPSTSHTLKASTEVGETFRLLAEGVTY